MLEINNCCKSFGNHTVLQDVSLTIPDGSIIGVFGASGIGKSTLAKILCGVMPPDAGAVFLDGKLLADILAQMQLPPKILAHLPRQISGGEAQRVALARCLLLSPKLLILDEATSMLDVSTQANLLALVKAQMLPNGGSVLFISHDWALTNFYCDTVYEFDETHQLKEVRA